MKMSAGPPREEVLGVELGDLGSTLSSALPDVRPWAHHTADPLLRAPFPIPISFLDALRRPSTSPNPETKNEFPDQMTQCYFD